MKLGGVQAGFCTSMKHPPSDTHTHTLRWAASAILRHTPPNPPPIGSLAWLDQSRCSSISVSSSSDDSTLLLNSTEGSLWEQNRSVAWETIRQACSTGSPVPKGGGSLQAFTTESRSWHTESASRDPASASGGNQSGSRPWSSPLTLWRAHSDCRNSTWGKTSWGRSWRWGVSAGRWRGTLGRSSGVSESVWTTHSGPKRSWEAGSTVLSQPGTIKRQSLTVSATWIP